MVQYFQRGPTKAGLTAQLLGKAIGGGIGDTIGAYYANKALTDVLEDKELANASPEQRMGALQKRLGIHGRYGEQVLKNRLDIEQQAAASTAAQNKPAPGGLSGQPVPPDVQAALSAVVQANPDANADQLLGAMDEAGIPRTYSNAYIESRRRQDEADAKTLAGGSDADKEALQQYSAYRRDAQVLDELARVADRPLPKPLTVSMLGKLGIPLGVLENPDAEELEKLSQGLLNNIQATYGSRILKVEVDNFLRTIPGLLNSPEGRRRLIEQWRILNEGKKAYYDAYRQVRDANRKRMPDDWRLQVQDIADGQLDDLSAQFARTSTAPITADPPKPKFRGQPITDDIVDKYLDAAGGDPATAQRMAADDGYSF